MTVSLKLRGDLEVTVPEQSVRMKVIVVDGRAGGTDPLFGVEPVDPIPVGDVNVKAGVALIPFLGDGTYEIKPGSPYDAAKSKDAAGQTGEKADKSSVRVEWWPTAQEPQEFLRRVKPCTVEVDDGGRKGRLLCPQLTQEGSDKRFSLEFTWHEE